MQINPRRNLSGALAMLTATTGAVLSGGCGGGSNSPTTTVVQTPPSFKIPNSFTTIDGPGGGATTINGISNTGTVVGLTAANGTNSNFLRSAGGTFTPLSVGDNVAGMATAVNSSGTVVGVANNSAFVLTGGQQTTLAPTGSTASVAFGVNDGGTIVGQDTVGANMPGFVDVGGTFAPINPTGTATSVFVQGINNKGQAIGFYSTAASPIQHGFLYDINTHQATLLPDPNTARIQSGGLALTQFLGLNDNNEAVGYYQTTNGSQFGFLFNLTTQAYTFLDDPQAAPVNGVQITQITGVDNAGEICGFYIDSAGSQHGFTAVSAN